MKDSKSTICGQSFTPCDGDGSGMARKQGSTHIGNDELMAESPKFKEYQLALLNAICKDVVPLSEYICRIDDENPIPSSSVLPPVVPLWPTV